MVSGAAFNVRLVKMGYKQKVFEVYYEHVVEGREPATARQTAQLCHTNFACAVPSCMPTLAPSCACLQQRLLHPSWQLRPPSATCHMPFTHQSFIHSSIHSYVCQAGSAGYVQKQSMVCNQFCHQSFISHIACWCLRDPPMSH